MNREEECGEIAGVPSVLRSGSQETDTSTTHSYGFGEHRRDPMFKTGEQREEDGIREIQSSTRKWMKCEHLAGMVAAFFIAVIKYPYLTNNLKEEGLVLAHVFRGSIRSVVAWTYHHSRSA